MIGRLGMAPRIDALSLTEFQHHWRTSHADAVAALPGLRAYIQFHAALDEGGELLTPYPGFDACSLLVFDSIEAMDDAFVSPQFTSAVVADENEFVDKSDFCGLLGNWDTAAQNDVGHGLLLMELWDQAPALAAPVSLAAHEPWHEGRFRAAAHTVTWRVFDSTGEAIEAAEQSRRDLGPAAQHLCEPISVIAF